jgi:nitrate reductase gamma subunit
MSGIIWPILTFCIIGLFIIIIIYRVITLNRLPAHLRWELAPIPGEKGKGKYGGSYLEEYEYWDKTRNIDRVAPVLYMLEEILFMKGVWKNNRSLWPMTTALHLGIYFMAGLLVFSVINAILIGTQVPSNVLNVFLIIATVLAFIGYILGIIGSIGLIIKRISDSNLQPFTTLARYFNLVFLAAVFISGFCSLLILPDFSYQLGLFLQKTFTVDTSLAVPISLSVHIIIALLFILYLPTTDMAHFFAKYFLYEEVRWNDKPLNKKMEVELNSLLAQDSDWSAEHTQQQ